MQGSEKPKDKRRMRGEASRKISLRSAVDSIAASGLGNMTLDRVAERAEISRGLAVFHFKSKRKLLKAVLEFLGQQYALGWNETRSKIASSDMERLLQIIDFDIRFAYENPRYVSAWHAFWGEAKGNLLYHDISFPRDEDYANEIEALVSRISEENGCDLAEVEPITKGLYVMLFGVWVESHLNPNPDDCDRYMRAFRVYLSKCFPGETIQ